MGNDLTSLRFIVIICNVWIIIIKVEEEVEEEEK